MQRGLVVRRGGFIQDPRNNPMQSRLPMLLSPRCGARTRRGDVCRSPAMPNGRCRMHGGLSPGAPKGNRHALKHGRYGAEAIARRREITALLRSMRVLAAAAGCFGRGGGRGSHRNRGTTPCKACGRDAGRARAKFCGTTPCKGPGRGPGTGSMKIPRNNPMQRVHRRVARARLIVSTRRGIVAIGQHCCRKASSGVMIPVLPPSSGVQ
jgi:hypothetical protein